MKKLLSLLVVAALLLCSVSCSFSCPHLDGDKNGFCDVCAAEISAEQTPEGGEQNPEGGEHTVHTTTPELVCSVCGERVPYHYDGSYVYMGEYPQSVKADDVTITETVDERGYYLGSDGFYYAKVYTDVGTAVLNGYTFANGETIERHVDYYFKVEPIRWRVHSNVGGQIKLVTDCIFERRAYGSNSYSTSGIRNWLNNDFRTSAFTEEQLGIIVNGTENDKGAVSLLDYYAAARIGGMGTSDYVRAKAHPISLVEATYGNGWWWIIGEWPSDTSQKRVVKYDGSFDYMPGKNASGVVATITVNIGE